MGGNQSVNKTPRKGREPSQAEIDYILQRQREIYEERYRGIQNQTANISTGSSQNTQSPHSQVMVQLQRELDQIRIPSNRNNIPAVKSSEPSSTGNNLVEINTIKQQQQLFYEKVKQQKLHNSQQAGPSHAHTNTSTAMPPSNRGICEDFEFVRCEPSAPSASLVNTDTRRPQQPKAKRVPQTQANKEYNCPTCKNRFGLKIFQCSKGHSACHECKTRCMMCGICSLPIGDMRNITLESLIAELKVPCKYSKNGCVLNFKMTEMDTHLKECPFGEAVCPFNAFGMCSWRGAISEMGKHFDSATGHDKADVDEEMCLSTLNNNFQTVYYVNIGPFKFLLHIKVAINEKRIYMAVQHLGTELSALKWTYEFHVYNKAKPRMKYQFRNACTSAGSPVNDLFKEANCAVLPILYLNNFINNNRLTYKFFIKKNCA